jgi:o-succinylbenzoate synthase
VKFESAEIVRGVLPLKSSFETSLGAQDDREFILVHVFSSAGEGWGECVAPSLPFYSAEFIDSAAIVLRELLLPAVMAQDHITAADLTALLRPVRGHRMAKSAVEMAVLDAQLQQAEMSFADYLGATTTSVPSGVSVGIQPDLDRLIATVGGFIADGYVRIKLKIKPGWDIEPLTAVRESFGGSLPLQVDANAAYSPSDARHLAKLDRFDLLMVEQPLGADDLTEHARLRVLMDTPSVSTSRLPARRAPRTRSAWAPVR